MIQKEVKNKMNEKRRKEIINEYLPCFKNVALENEKKRGAILLMEKDFSNKGTGDFSVPFGRVLFVPLIYVEKHSFKDAVRMVKDYNLKNEFIIIFCNGNKEICYRVGLSIKYK